MVVAVRVRSHPVEFNPQEGRPVAAARGGDGLATGDRDRVHRTAVDMADKFRIEDAEAEWQLIKCRRTDPVTVVLDDEDDRQAVLHGLDYGLVEFSLPGGRIANRAQHDARLACKLDTPCGANGRQALRGGGRGGRIDAEAPVGTMHGHLAATRRRMGGSQIFPRHFERRHAARLHQCAIAVIEKQQVIPMQRCGQRGQRFVPLARDMDPAAALAQQALFAQIAGANQKELTELVDSRAQGGVCDQHGQRISNASRCRSKRNSSFASNNIFSRA